MGRQPLPTNTILGNGIDQYRIDTVLGPGGFGITYLAHDLRFDRDVAIKEYFPAEFAVREGTTSIRSSGRGQGNFFDQGKRYFLDEARTLGKFRHEHIVRVLNLFEQFNTAYMVLEFEEGQSLKSWLRYLGRRPTQDEIDRILEPMLSALEAIHAKGMFHRDIAPDNIILRPNGEPVLIDFGAARNFVRENSYTIGAIVKHGYSPPEQYTLDTKLQGAWSDIYALSATIYFAIMGEPPEEAARRQLQDSMLPIESHIDAYHRGLYRPSLLAALNAGLALKPKQRPQTVAELRALLKRDVAEVVPVGNEAAARLIARRPRTRIAAPDAGTVVQGLDPITGLSRRVLLPAQSERPEPAAPAPAPAEPAPTSYPEPAMRVAGILALAVAAAAAFGFLMIGGIEHPGGLAAVMLVCGGLVGAGFERVLALARSDSGEVRGTAATAAVMSALALAIYWLPLFLWPISLVLAMAAAAFGLAQFGRWVPVTLLAMAVIHLAGAALLLLLATRTVQKDPFFLPLMGASLAVIAGLVMASALQIQRRWEPVTP
ncbi:MAG: serine/threonine-protein kinase [Hyphomicrobiaceae bacterium]|nr:serine/threonine-protein kinase [Hyphomicrobiaceae bacterium]